VLHNKSQVISTLSLLLATVTGSLWATQARGDIYKYVDPTGHVHLADRPLDHRYVRIMVSKRPASRSSTRFKPGDRRQFDALVARTAHRYRLDSALIHAVITVESAYDAHAVSRVGAVGLMQLMPATARRYGVRNRRNPSENVDAGTRYLRDLLAQFRSLSLALAAYNAGENAVAKYGNRIPPFPETQAYVRKVMGYYHAYRRSS
jgi:soluble lytic murein transglycosylase-like protein